MAKSKHTVGSTSSLKNQGHNLSTCKRSCYYQKAAKPERIQSVLVSMESFIFHRGPSLRSHLIWHYVYGVQTFLGLQYNNLEALLSYVVICTINATHCSCRRYMQNVSSARVDKKHPSAHFRYYLHTNRVSWG